MSGTRLMVLGAAMAALAVLFQSGPLILTEAFVFITILSTFPLYITARIRPRAGLAVYLVAGFLILGISLHEALFFLFGNGPVGLCLGSCRYWRTPKAVTYMITAFVLTLSIGLVNFIVGIDVFGTPIPGDLWTQFTLLFLFSLVYSLVLNRACEYIYKLFTEAEI